MGGDESREQSAVMGVRGAEADDGFGFEWVEEDTLSYNEALSAFEEGDYALASTILEEEVDPLVLEDPTGYWYHLASAVLNSEKGSKARAMKLAVQHEGDRMSPYYDEFLLLRGRLYLESLDFDSAAEEYGAYIDTASSPQEKQLGYYLYGYALSNGGNSQKGRNAIERAAEIDADAEITRAARDMLE
jgi:tetratricopeptide (TPR) repeat protein